MTIKKTARSVEVGDWIEARGLPGHGPRRGQILELLGRDEHRHYRVRWDEQHESILYPTDGVIITPHREPRAESARR